MDGSELIQRPDDTEDVISERLAAYDAQTQPLVDYYTPRGVLQPVDAMAPRMQVTDEYCKDFGRSGSARK